MVMMKIMEDNEKQDDDDSDEDNEKQDDDSDGDDTDRSVLQ